MVIYVDITSRYNAVLRGDLNEIKYLDKSIKLVYTLGW